MNSSAPSPGVSGAAPPGAANASDILGTCREGDFTCYKNTVSDNQILTALWVSIIVGVVALFLFAALRSRIKTFHTRLCLGSVWIPPPDLPVGGINHLWSWILPLFRTSDAELVHTAGLDALILSWVCSMGIQIFLPVSILGAVMLLPINLSGDRVNQDLRSQDPSAAASTFSKLTVSNIARGSAYYWVVFAFVYIVTAYICWVLIKYYQAYIVLRQHYLLGGENLINEWHLQFLAQKEAAEKDPSTAAHTSGPLAALKTLFDPTAQVSTIAEEVEEAASLYSGYPTMPRVTVGGALANTSSRLGRDNASVASGRRSNRSLLSTALRRRRRAERSPSPNSRKPFGHISPTSPVSAPSNRPLRPQGRMWKSTEGALHRGSPRTELSEAQNNNGGLVGGPGNVIPPPAQEMGHRREGSELTREVLEAAGMAPSHGDVDAVPGGEVLHDDDMVNPGGGGLRSAVKAKIHGRFHKPSIDTTADEEEQHVKGRSSKSVRFLSYSVGRVRRLGLIGQTADVSDSQELMDRSVQRSTSLPAGLGSSSQSPSMISRYEREPPSEEGRERIHQWWRPAEGADTTTRAGSIQAGKPNVSFRKIINTKLPDGSTIGVNAQSYTVLVMDVPDISKERRKAARRAARQRWWWRLWYRFVAFCKVRILLRKDVDRRTGDFIMPAAPAPKHGNLGGAADAIVRKGEGNGSVELASIHVDKEGVHPVQVWPIEEELPSKGPDSDRQQAPKTHVKDVDVAAVQSTSGPTSEREKIWRTGSGGDASYVGTDGILPSPKSMATVQIIDDAESEVDEDDITSEYLVRETFKNLFPESFDGVLPIRKHKAVDLLLAQWNTAWHKLIAAEQKYEKTGCTKRPVGKPKCCGCAGKRVDLIDHWAKEIRRLEIEIVKARQVALNSQARTSYFVFFTSQKDAAIAAQTNLHPEDGHSFQVHEAPGPEEVNWQALWMTWAERDIRGVVTLIPLAVLMLFPIGLFSGAVNQLTVAICNGNSFLNIFYSSWYCKKSSLARSLVTGVLPSVLLMLWQNLVMPSAVYRIAQQQGASPSLSSLDRRIGVIFFIWDIFNVFLGAMLGGSIFSQLGTVIKNPGYIASSIGTALPTASNFFINFIILQAFATQTVRMLLPHLGIIPDFFRLCGACMPKSDLQKAEALSPHSIRYGREIGAILLIYLEAMAYAATSPIILPFALIYFGAAWVHWRYNILYISERCYESGGRSWDMTFQCMVWILFIFELFTGFVLLANSAFAQATVMWLTLTPLLYKFSQYCEVRYGAAVRHMPIETAAAAPLASVPAVVYMPPALRKGAAGWYPEFGKAWENFGMPAYTW